MSDQTDACPVPRLQDYCQRVILANIDSVVSTGDIPFRVIRPVLERCKANKLFQLEQESPHLKSDTQAIWKKKCLDEFIDIRQSYESASVGEPRSWRKRYFAARDEREQKINNSASRLRGMYQQGESSKRDRQTLYTSKAPPPKRGRFGPITMSKPRTLIDKARQDTKKIQHVWTAPSSPPVARRKLGQSNLFIPSRPRPTSAPTAKSSPIARVGSDPDGRSAVGLSS